MHVMIRLIISALGCFALAFSSHLRANAPLEYFAPIDKSEWYVSTSIFECSIIHDVPRYGQGVFYHEAGEDLHFYSQTVSNPMRPGKSALVIEASQWRPGNAPRELGYVEVKDQDKPLFVESKRARDMMKGLLEGMQPTFTRKAWFSDASVRLALNSVGFSNVYEDYLSCISSLLPVNFRQVERTRVHFDSDKAVLMLSEKKRLDMVVLYVQADSTVTAVYVDGHTDATGRRIYNRRLSKNRADVVRDYLVSKGLNSDLIQTRYHGERYPVANNRTASNKAKNRRTTVRLVRGGLLSLPTDESPDGELN